MKIFHLFKRKKLDFNDNHKIEIENLLNETDKNTLFVDILLWLEDKCSYGDNIEVLSKPELHILVIREFFDEVMNGGFQQFLDNSSGNQYNYLIDSLKDVEATDVLNIYEDTLKSLPRLPADRKKEMMSLRKY